MSETKVTNIDCIRITEDARVAGVDTEDWDELVAWVLMKKGKEVAAAFIERCSTPL